MEQENPKVEKFSTLPQALEVRTRYSTSSKISLLEVRGPFTDSSNKEWWEVWSRETKCKFSKLFRESLKGSAVCIQIHDSHYGHSLEHILEMVKELKTDFPSILDKDIQVQQYGGQRIKGITFIEVFLPKETVMPKGYERVSELEYVK